MEGYEGGGFQVIDDGPEAVVEEYQGQSFQTDTVSDEGDYDWPGYLLAGTFFIVMLLLIVGWLA